LKKNVLFQNFDGIPTVKKDSTSLFLSRAMALSYQASLFIDKTMKSATEIIDVPLRRGIALFEKSSSWFNNKVSMFLVNTVFKNVNKLWVRSFGSFDKFKSTMSWLGIYVPLFSLISFGVIAQTKTFKRFKKRFKDRGIMFQVSVLILSSFF
jgi:hypothetical protein